MSHTARLPFNLAQYAPDYVPRADATVFISPAYVPDFGIVPNAVVPGSNVAPNLFYNPDLQYANVSAQIPLTQNMQANYYLGYIPGIMRVPLGST